MTGVGGYRIFSVLFMSLGLLVTRPCFAQEVADPESVLIRNVSLIDRQERSDGVLVNILIEDGKLKVVTRDEISKENITLIVDARRGFLLGKLDGGQPPSFLIFLIDPRENAELLLDTKTHAVFVMQRGKVLKNMLIDTIETDIKKVEKSKKSGWLAYTPPPMALPLSYGGESAWNQWDSKYVSGIFIAAMLVDRQKWLSQDQANEQLVGDLTEFDGGEIRGFRFGAVGTLNFARPWVYTFFVANNTFDKGFDSDTTDAVTLFDFRLDIPIPGGFNVSIGKQKEPISMERMMALFNLPMQERSAVADAMQRSRNIGVVLSGTMFSRRMSWAGGLFNDWIETGESFDSSSNQFVGRVTGLPFISEDESNLLHLGFGWRYTDAKAGLRFQTTPELNNSPTFVDTGEFDAASAITYNLETSWRKGPIWVSGEYVQTRVDAPASLDPVFTGYNVGASWALTGEMRAYNRKSGALDRLQVATPVYQGGKGAWEIAVRWSNLDLTDGLIEGGEMKILSLGLNWWAAPLINASINYRHIDLDRFDISGGSNGLNVRVTLMLE